MKSTTTLAVSLLGTALLASASIAQAESATYAIEPTHTSVVFEARHFGTSTVRARIPAKSGTITIDPAAKTGKGSIVIDTPAVISGVPKLDTNLKSGDFFNVERFPEATFVATDFRFEGEKVTQISGNLTIVGVTQPVTLNGTNYNCYQSPEFKKQVCGGDFETTIKRSLWNINFAIPFVPDETKLLVQIEAIRS